MQDLNRCAVYYFVEVLAFSIVSQILNPKIMTQYLVISVSTLILFYSLGVVRYSLTRINPNPAITSFLITLPILFFVFLNLLYSETLFLFI